LDHCRWSPPLRTGNLTLSELVEKHTLDLRGGLEAHDTSLSQVDIDVSSSQSSGGIANSAGGACSRRTSQFASSIICNLAGIPATGSATVTFSAVPVATGTLSATATAAFAVTLSQASTNVSIAAAPTDVQVTGSASTGSPSVGSTYFYTFQVKDNGPWGAPGVTFADTLPSVVGFIGASTTAGTCNASGGTVSCSFGDLQVGEQATVTITVQAPATPQTFTDTASVSMTDTDRQPSNNSVGVSVQVR
jgi:uncharacterized repeat protein (TIGR01451 family)